MKGKIMCFCTQNVLERSTVARNGIVGLTDADILRCVALLDERGTKGGDRKSENIKVQGCTLISGKTSERTAEVIGISPREHTRHRMGKTKNYSPPSPLLVTGNKKPYL